MKKVLLAVLTIISLLLLPQTVSAAPKMVTYFYGPGFAVGVLHKSEADEILKELDGFIAVTGCGHVDKNVLDTTGANYQADNPVNGRPSAEWLAGAGKAVGADYAALVYSDISGLHAGSMFHTSPKMTVTTDMRIVRVSDGSTIFNCAVPPQEGKREEVLTSVAALFDKAAKDVKASNIAF